ncbi:hypothetical protein [Kineococcus rubinsiae]|uniref:hypothetical protein n=1 Tax=Kineococcus rubinsiae TaxID=2609562 RepID=UPI00143173E8|nr:hypothetical protein [Kineococcus rubinsiae]NIZ90708.1 hypothetical protein [Kineococcus rubinsiae]
MFLKTKPAKKTPVEQLQAQVREQGLALAKQVGPAAGAAVVGAKTAVEGAKEWATPVAKDAVDWATPHVGAARDWAQPKLEKGWSATQEAAAPRLAAAAAATTAAVTPVVEQAREKLVEDVLPRLSEAAHHAGTAAQVAAAPAVAAATAKAAAVGAKATGAAAVTAGAAGAAKHRSADALAVLKGEAVVKPKHRGRKVLLVALVVGLGAAAFSALRKGKDEDPWATPGATWTPTASATTPAATPAPAEPAEGSTVVIEDAAGDAGTQDGAHVADGDHPAS